MYSGRAEEAHVSRTVTAALHVLLLVLLLALVLVQAVVLPGFADDTALQFPEAAQLRTPVLVLAISTVGCVQIASSASESCCPFLAVTGAGTTLLMVHWRDGLSPAAEQHPVLV